MMSINAAIDIYIDNYVCFSWCVYTSDSDQAIIHTCTTLVADDLNVPFCYFLLYVFDNATKESACL